MLFHAVILLGILTHVANANDWQDWQKTVCDATPEKDRVWIPFCSEGGSSWVEAICKTVPEKDRKWFPICRKAGDPPLTDVVCKDVPKQDLQWVPFCREDGAAPLPFCAGIRDEEAKKWISGCRPAGAPALTDLTDEVCATIRAEDRQWVPQCTKDGKLAENNGKTEAEDDKKGDDPCFARDTFALSATGEPVPMASLRSGDIVLDGPSSTTRVIVNQHREATFKSALVAIKHANGKLALTPDHVLAVDGAFVAARNAAPGSKLGASEVSHVAYTAGEVINPLTASGKILTQGGVLASTYPEWIAEYMLSSVLVPLPLSLSNLASYLFPETTQAYYDALIEPLVTVAHPKHLKAALPAALYPAAFLAADLALVAGFVGFSLASPMVVAAAIAVVALHKARK